MTNVIAFRATSTRARTPAPQPQRAEAPRSDCYPPDGLAFSESGRLPASVHLATFGSLLVIAAVVAVIAA